MTTAALQQPPARARAGALAATLGLAAAGWSIAIPRMGGMDMGVATTLGSFPFFVSVWVPMMAAMMLPGLVSSSLRLATTTRRTGSYLAVWTLVGVVVYALYRPHSPAVAGAVALAAGLYELTPLKRRFRRSCRERVMSGWELGLCCFGSSIGLMLVMLAFGAMSVGWMVAVTVALSAQKLLPPRAAVDIPVAAALIALGLIELAR